jgi:predicted dehydrogenase/threonine dehydrogenase-like Zn-dependent dehydrogenase
MLQAIIKKGKVVAEEVTTPILSKGEVLISVSYSCISSGTELKSVNNSSGNLISKAIKEPENLKRVLSLAKAQGINRAFSKVQQKIKYGTPTGYSNSGIVIAVGENITKFKIGDKVAAAGAGIANHAEFVSVPENLVSKIPDGLDLKLASTVTLGGIALQGVRRADLRLGEYALIIGAGALGQLTLQLLKNSGVRTIVSDINEDRLNLAKQLGAELTINPNNEDIVKTINHFTDGFGADAVVFTASTNSSKPLAEAFKACKQKGRVILVGVSGMTINREDIYKKELDFLVSTSYGPGRYDRSYEEKGNDYPYAYVRWTENRNMTEYLKMLSEDKINLDPLINSVVPIENVEEAYATLQSPEKPIMLLLSYNINEALPKTTKIPTSQKYIKPKNTLNVALIGAGSFATAMHLPNMQKLKDKFSLYAVVNKTGHKSKTVATHYKAQYTTSNINDVLEDDSVDVVFITTPHQDHAALVLKSLEAGKHVFVEKPLAINKEELNKIKSFYLSGNVLEKPILFTGFNRRFSKYIQEINTHTSKRISPLYLSYRVNAGFKNTTNPIHDFGGRVIGEACHFIDVISFLTNANLVSINVEKITPKMDTLAVLLKYDDGSIANLQYFALGHQDYQKETLEVHFDEKTIVLDNFMKLTGYGLKVKKLNSKTPEKGQFEELTHFYKAIKTNTWAISLESMISTTEATFLINNQ